MLHSLARESVILVEHPREWRGRESQVVDAVFRIHRGRHFSDILFVVVLKLTNKRPELLHDERGHYKFDLFHEAQRC